MNFHRISLFIFFFAVAFLVFKSVAISRDYQDSWVLEGLEIPFAIFAVTYSLAFFSERKITSLVALAVMGRFVFLLVPNLKYVWFQGTAIDQQRQYALSNYINNNGYIHMRDVYGSTPLEHLVFSEFSLILGIPVVDSMKYLPVLLSPLFPLLTFVIINNMAFFKRTSVLKYGLFFSSIPVNIQAYVVTGSQFGVLLAFLIASSLVLLQKKDRRYFAIITFLALALAMAHSVTSTLIAIFLLMTFVFQRVFYSSQRGHFLSGAIVLTLAFISLAWLMFPANTALGALVSVVFFAAPKGVTPGSEYVPTRFFELLHASIFEAIKTFLVYYGAEVFLMFLSITGLIILLIKRKQLDNASKFLFLYSGTVLVSIPFTTLLKVGTFRVLYFAGPMLVVLSAIFVSHTCEGRAWSKVLIFSSILLLATLEVYTCQPLIPSANIVLKDLPTTEPIGYTTQVNSAYQREMIFFAERHVMGRIAADSMTRSQIEGLTGFDFSASHLIDNFYPLGSQRTQQRYDFLIHLPGKSGTFGEKAEVRSPNLIFGAIYNSNVVYANGESYMLYNFKPSN